MSRSLHMRRPLTVGRDAGYTRDASGGEYDYDGGEPGSHDAYGGGGGGGGAYERSEASRPRAGEASGVDRQVSRLAELQARFALLLAKVEC